MTGNYMDNYLSWLESTTPAQRLIHNQPGGTIMITNTIARYTGTWVITQAIEPGSVPDRPFGTRTSYRPAGLKLEFSAAAVAQDPYKLGPENARPVMALARDQIVLTAVVITGLNLGRDGTPGATTRQERIYPHTLATAPDWVQTAAAAALADLKGTG